MSIVFFCQSCGSRFEVDDRAACKQGRCNKCGQRMVVPKGEPIARQPIVPALAAAPAPAGSNWLANVASSVGLVPLSSDRLFKIGTKKKPSPLDDDMGDGKPYELAKPERVSHGRSSKPAGRATILWRTQLAKLEKLFRWINQTAYLLSVPFIMLVLFGAVTRNRHLAIIGAIVVVVLNIGRLISGFANVAIIPFRDGISWKRLKKPLQRVIEPVFTIGLVIAAFAFLPSLSKEGTGKGARHREPGLLQKLQERVEDEQAKAREIGKQGQ
jgi:hypothetical protein